MAATFRTSATSGGTSGTTNRTVAITPAVGDLLVCFAAISGNANLVPSMTDNNASSADWALVGVCRWSSSANMMACWVRKALMANTTSTTITAVTGSNTAAQLVVVAYSGVTRVGLNAIRQWTGQENATIGTPTPVFPQAALTGNATLWAVASLDTTTTPPASWTERQDASQATPTTALEVATRDFGFTGTSMAAGAAASTVFASMAVELDSSSSTFGIGVSTGAQRSLGGATSGTHTTPAVDTTNGNTYVVGMARGNWATASPAAPSDSQSNTYTLIGSVNSYSSFPDSKQGIYRIQSGTGGSGHTFSAAFGSFDVPPTVGDEITSFMVELTGSLVLETVTHVTRAGAATVTTGNVTTTGKALLLAVVWGTNNVGVTHFFTPVPSGGFIKLTDCCFEADPSTGYIQCSVFYKIVDAAGTYSGTFTTQNSEGAEIDLIAFQVGAAAYTGSPSETVTLSEGAAAAVTYTVGIGESVSVAEALAASRGHVVAVSDSAFALSESMTSLHAATAGPAETIAFVEAIAAMAARTIGAAESVALAETLAGGLQLTADVAETVTLADAIGAMRAAIAAMPETLALIDALAAARATTGAVGEAVGLSDALAVVRGSVVGVGESVTLSEAVATVRAAIAGLAESVTLSEAIAALVAFAAGLADTLTLSDLAASEHTGNGTSYSGNVGETVAWLEVIAVRLDALAVVADSVVLVEEIDARLGTAITVGDVLAFIDAISSGEVDPPLAAIFMHAPFSVRWVHGFATVFVDDEGATMSDERELRQGDVPKTVRARAFTSDAYADGGDYSGITFRMVGPATVEGAATLDANGYLAFTFTGTDLDTPGDYLATWRAASGPNGEPQTFPEATNLRVRVVAAV